MFTAASKSASAGRVTATAFGELLLSPLVSLHRYETLRRLLGFSTGAAQQDVADAALFLAGVDCRDDPVNAAILTYLFVGTPTSVLPTELEDVMLTIHVGGATLYTAPAGVYTIALVTKLWPHLTIVALPQSKFNDQSRFEEDKMNAFRAMVRPHKTIGMVWSATRSDARRHGAAVVEGWPIVQSYAFDADGARPFFSMDKKVVSVAARLVPAVATPLDAHEILQTYGLTAELMALQFEATLAWAEQSTREVLDAPLTSVNTDLCRTVNLFHEHCALARLNDDESLAQERHLQAPAFADSAASSAVIEGTHAHQRRTIVLRLAHPWLPVAVTRTYPLAFPGRDAIALEELRVAAVMLRECAAAFFQQETSSSSAAVDAATMAASWSTFLAKRGAATHSSHASVLLARGDTRIVYLELALLTSADSARIVVGDTLVVVLRGTSVVVNALTSSVPYIDALRTASHAEEALAAAYAAQADQPPSKRAAMVAQVGTSGAALGKLVIDVTRADGVAVVVGRAHNVSGSSTGAVVYLCEKGLVVTHKRLGVLGPCLLSDLTVFNPNDTSSNIVIEWRTPADHSLGHGVSVAVLIKDGSYGRREFLANVLPLWRSAGTRVYRSTSSSDAQAHLLFVPVCEPTTTTGSDAISGVAVTSGVPAAVAALDPFPARRDESTGNADDEDPESDVIRRDTNARRAIAVTLPGLTTAAFAMHSPGELPTTAASDPSLSPVKSGGASNGATSLRFLLHLISGPIASQKHKLAAQLLRVLGSEAAAMRTGSLELRVRHVVASMENCLAFSATAFAVDLQALVAREDATPRPDPQPGHAAATRTVVVVVVQLSPNACLPSVVEAVETVNRRVGSRVEITSSTSVANTDAFYGDQSGDAPGLPAQGTWRALVPGFVDTVLITSNSRYTRVSAGRVERSIRHALGSSSFPQALVGLPQEGAPLLVGPSAASQLQFAYSIDEAVKRCLEAQAPSLDASTGSTWGTRLLDPALAAARGVLLRATAATSYSALTCAASQAYLPRLVTLHFDRMPLIEPDLLDFLGHLSDPPRTSPFLGVIRCKAYLHVEGRPCEFTAVRYRAHLNRLRRKADAGGTVSIGLRQDQTFYFFCGGDATENDDVAAMERYLLRFVAYRGSLVGDVLMPREREEDSTDAQRRPDSARTRHKVPRPLISRADLTDADVAKICQDATQQGVPLPAGWAYDGQYRNVETGDITDTRPDAESLACEFIATRNAAAEEYNAAILSGVRGAPSGSS